MSSFHALQPGSNHGTPNMYVGTTPGTAGQASTDGGASLQPGGFPFGSVQPRRTVNQTIGNLTNHSVPRTSVVRRLKTNGDQFIRKGQYVFMHTKFPSDRTHRNSVSAPETLMNLPLVNFYLAKLSEDQAYRNKSAGEIAADFVPHGVVLNSVGEDAKENAERMVVCTVRGFADTFNVWGTDCFDGDSLYFAYKKVKVGLNHAGYKFDFNGGAHHIPQSHEKLIWQVIPCTRHGEDRPTVESLRDTSNRTMATDQPTPAASEGEGDGVVRYVGRIQHARSAHTMDTRKQTNEAVWTHLSAMTNQFQFTMFLDH